MLVPAAFNVAIESARFCVFVLGPAYLSRLTLQQHVWFLGKAELM